MKQVSWFGWFGWFNSYGQEQLWCLFFVVGGVSVTYVSKDDWGGQCFTPWKKSVCCWEEMQPGEMCTVEICRQIICQFESAAVRPLEASCSICRWKTHLMLGLYWCEGKTAFLLLIPVALAFIYSSLSDFHSLVAPLMYWMWSAFIML